MKFIQIQWTCAHLEEARSIARALVEHKLVACANIIPHIESIYLWEGKIETAQEVKVFLKTKEHHFSKVRAFIEERASYEVSEISKIIVDEGNPAYLEWLERSV